MTQISLRYTCRLTIITARRTKFHHLAKYRQINILSRGLAKIHHYYSRVNKARDAAYYEESGKP